MESFRTPLEGAGAVVSEICSEFEEVVLYATQFITFVYNGVLGSLWQLFHSPDSSAWSSVLTLATLLFSLPVSNGKLERVFLDSSLQSPGQEKHFSILFIPLRVVVREIQFSVQTCPKR